MATNGSNDVAIRDERGRYLKGMPGGPGRPAGSRNKLTEYFLGDMLDAWGRREVATLNGHSVPNLLPLPWRTADDARAARGPPAVRFALLRFLQPQPALFINPNFARDFRWLSLCCSNPKNQEVSADREPVGRLPNSHLQ
jgi:hypothetical protein